ncbi:hypothetical protein ACFFK0_26150 [Paenibacillus chartarius]|uniref:Uncharacterized protein n=1 Tax=Paenibacillus chartarius TaxID=747481 RepID=A0ABV6DTD7_9BACL
MKSTRAVNKVSNNAVCVVITQIGDDLFRGYVPQLQAEIIGGSVQEVKHKLRLTLANVELLPNAASSIITFVELD